MPKSFRCGHARSKKNSMPRGDGKGMKCRRCSYAHNLRWRRAHPEWYVAEQRKLRKQRITPLLKKQKGRCAICDEVLKFPYEDHNHRTGRKRGLLCPSCNGGLHLIESKRLHRAAIAYLEKWCADA